MIAAKCTCDRSWAMAARSLASFCRSSSRLPRSARRTCTCNQATVLSTCPGSSSLLETKVIQDFGLLMGIRVRHARSSHD